MKPSDPRTRPVDFSRQIQPLLADRCFNCHGPDAAKVGAGLRLDVREGALARRPNGRFPIVPGRPGTSEFVRRMLATDGSVMPPRHSSKSLNAAEKELLRQWIAQGAEYRKHWAFEAPRRPALPAVKRKDWVRNPIDAFVLARLEREGLPPNPPADRTTLIRRVTLDLTGLPPTPAEVDTFLKECEAEDRANAGGGWGSGVGGHPLQLPLGKGESSRSSRVAGEFRPLTPDPQPHERQRVNPTSAASKPHERQRVGPRAHGAYERLVDRLLASPRFGERMAWDWLDAARYADTNGYQGDRTRTMWFWRDWVVGAYNRDLPFDQFTIEQLAGDLLPNPTLDQRIATGFNRNHMLNGEGGRIAEESRVDYVVDRVDTTSTVWMGLTAGCARCHDHKYDPISQKEYYQLFAYFNNLPETGSVDRGGQANPVLIIASDDQKRRLSELQQKAKALEQQLTGATAGDRAAVQKQLDDARKAARDYENGLPAAMVMEEITRPADRRTSHVLLKGAYDKKGEKVLPGVPAVLPPLPAATGESNRLALARWLVSPNHPLTARVAVNRTWQMLFGTGLVKTTEDFGIQGELPTHPELLDYLAVAFSSPSAESKPATVTGGRQGESGGGRVGTPVSATASGSPGPHSPQNWGTGGATPTHPRTHTPTHGLAWSTKALLRLIVTSATYQQSSRVTPALAARDPENRLLARGARYRLPSAAIRDQALAASGLLVEKRGGPSVKPYQPAGVWEDATFGKIQYVQDKGENLYRRSLYTFWRRIVGPTNLFDTASRQACTVRQARTNTPLHALTLLNDITFVEAARVLAQRIMLAESTPAARIELAFRLAVARRPTPAEQQILRARLDRLLAQYTADPAAAAKLLTIGEAPRDEKLSAAEHAAYAGLCSLILNLDEAITRE